VIVVIAKEFRHNLYDTYQQKILSSKKTIIVPAHFSDSFEIERRYGKKS
jgi:hypothetical protein